MVVEAAGRRQDLVGTVMPRRQCDEGRRQIALDQAVLTQTEAGKLTDMAEEKVTME